MIRPRIRVLAIPIGLSVLFAGGAARAQRLYDKTRDEQAQEAAKLAKDVSSGAVFDKQLKNLAITSRQDFAIHFLDARRTMRSEIGAFTQWKHVFSTVKRVKESLGGLGTPTEEEVKRVADALKKQLEGAKASVDRLQEQAGEGGDGQGADANKIDNRQVDLLFERVGDLGSLYQ